MIVRKDKSFNKMELYPNTDWLGNADWVLDDNNPKDAEIEEKIMELYPNFEFVLDDDGGIVDVKEVEPTSVEIMPTDHERLEALEAAFIEFVAGFVASSEVK